MRKKRTQLKSSLVSEKRFVDAIIEQTKKAVLQELGNGAFTNYEVIRAAQTIGFAAGSYGSVYLHGIGSSDYASNYWVNITGEDFTKGNMALGIRTRDGNRFIVGKINSSSTLG